jgi:predicted DNA-binding protein
MSSERNFKHTNLRVPAEHLETLAGLAKKEGLTTADLLRRAVREYLERQGQDQE